MYCTRGSALWSQPVAVGVGKGRRRSKRVMRAPVVALGAAVALLVAGVILAVANEHAYQAQKIDEVTVEARLLSVLVGGALDFDNRGAARDYLEALRANPEAQAGAIYDAHDQLFASYSRKHLPSLPMMPPPQGASFDGNRLIVSVPVTQEGRKLGSIYLDMLTEPIAHRLQRYLGIGLLVTMAALLVVVLGTAHSALTRANDELERRAVDLDAANRQLRAQIAERERAEEALRQSQKMEAIGRLTGGVAHDFNNLLTIVGGNLDLLDRMADSAADTEVPRDRLRRLVEAAQRGLARGAQLTRQLLALSRQEPLEARIVDINAAIADFASLVERAIGETVELRLALGDDSWPCKLDPAQFEAAILNLAINAKDAIEDGGRLTIGTELVRSADEPGGALELNPPYIVLTVADTGSGMPPDVLARIFEPFYTTKPVGKGSGLGLAQVWAFVTQTGGRIVVDSAPGSGTEFRMFLPLSPAAGDEAPGIALAGAEPGGSERILVVEDEEEVREVAAATLERLGYNTVVARDGREALAILDRRDFDLLFTDYVMPGGLNGAQLAHEACRRRPELKVLITSGYLGDGGAHIDGARVGGFALIAKPYRSAELATRVRETLDAVPAAPPG
jgi:signal transduction histidine kinase/ActR/RegA family two-component response regulator